MPLFARVLRRGFGRVGRKNETIKGSSFHRRHGAHRRQSADVERIPEAHPQRGRERPASRFGSQPIKPVIWRFTPLFFVTALIPVAHFIQFSRIYISAEKFLESVEVNQNYPLLLLHLVDKSEVNITIRIAGAVAFKNYVKRNWKVVSFSLFIPYSCIIFFHIYSVTHTCMVFNFIF